MVRDGFYEESAVSARSAKEAKFYLFFKIFAIICGVVAVFLLTFAFPFIRSATETANEDPANKTEIMIFALLPYFGVVLLFIAVGVGSWFLKNRFNVSYDYTFVEDELRITRVFNGKRRKFIMRLYADRILQIGWMDSEAFDRAVRGFAKKKIKRFTPNREPSEGKEFIYVIHSDSIEKTMCIIECRRQLLENLVMAAGRNKLERK